MCEFATLDRCAAYVAARALLIAVQRVTGSWPTQLADRARSAATAAVALTAEAIAHGPASAGRRRCLRDAITSAIGIAAAVDIAGAMGFGGAELGHVQRVAGRSVALLAMFLHANTAPIPEPS
jgi:hypothetical protein